MALNDSSETTTSSSNLQEDDLEINTESMSPEQKAIHKRRLELGQTQQDLNKLINNLQELVNGSSSSKNHDDISMMKNSNELDEDFHWKMLTKHATELQEIRKLSAFTDVLLNRIKKIIGGPEASNEKIKDSNNNE